MDIEAANDGPDDSAPASDQAGIRGINEQESPALHALPPKPVLEGPVTYGSASQIQEPDVRKDKSQPDDLNGDPNQGLGVAILPPEILQHSFSFVDPVSLGRLLSVSRLFNSLLDSVKSLPSASSSNGALQLRPQNDIWATSRRRYFTGYPRPMEDMSELEMWRLIRGVQCQFCGKTSRDNIPLLATSPWNAGPGPEGVRPIWPFRCRSCGPCLEARIIKETDLLLSSKSVLLQGLPFAVFTPSLHYVASVTLRQTQPPPRLQLTKFYFQPQVDELDLKQNEVRNFGPATMSEWYKGLEAKGQAHMKDAARFEQWQQPSSASLHIDPGIAGQISGSTSPALSLASSAMYSHQFSLQSPYRAFSAQSTPLHPGISSGPPHLPPGTVPPMPLQNFGLAPGQTTQSGHAIMSPIPPQHIGSAPSTFQPPPRPRQERTLQEIERVKSERRAEIRRRCLQTDPPIQPSTLDFMDAFNAAIQIARPLNENDWEVLKGRLMAQRGLAEQKQRQQQATTQAAHMEVADRENYEEQRRQAQDSADRIWTEIQKPSREKARDYAESYIRSQWADGRAVNKASSGGFAADVLQHTRQRYFEVLGQEDTLLESQNITIPHDSSIQEVRRLKLEDMKFVYEETIRPRIDRFGREVFLCNTCEASAKRFTFDAVIQHYAAKHTSSLSHGNAVVYWRADWPLEPPFHPKPDTVWNRPPEHRAAFPPFGATSPAYTPAYTPYLGASWMSPAPGQPNGIYHVQSEELVTSAKRVWDGTDQIRYLPESLRLYVVLHQVAMSFSRRFTNEPTLSMFSDCVNHKPLLKSLKDLTGLKCKACHTYGEASDDANLQYTLPDLLQHFQRTHVEPDARSPQPMTSSNVSTARLDWKFDMIDLPPEPVVRDVVHLPGMNQDKLEMIAEALPGYFPPPLPRIDQVPPTVEEHQPHQPQLADSGASILRYDVQSSFKRPLEEDPYSYPPALRRVIEYDPYQPHIAAVERYPGYGPPAGYAPHLESDTGSRVVYVERSYGAQFHDYERNPYGPPPFRIGYSGAVIKDASRRHVIREVGDAYARDLRTNDYLAEPAVIPEQHLSRPSSSARDLERPHPGHDHSLSATENFLKNFDDIPVRSFEGDRAPGPSRLDHRARLADAGRRSHATTPSRSRQSGEILRDVGPGSRRASPDASLLERQRSRNRSPIPPLDGPIRTRQETLFSRNEDAVARNTILVGSPPIPSVRDDGQDVWRRAPARHLIDRELSPRGEGAVPYEYDNYADSHVQMDRRPRYDQAPPSPPTHYQRYEERRPVRYIEVLPNGQRRVVEELPSPTFERLEYVRGPLREPYQPDRGGYYVDPPGYALGADRGFSGHPGFEPQTGQYRYGYDTRHGEHGLSASPPPAMRLVKYEDEAYNEAGPSEARH